MVYRKTSVARILFAATLALATAGIASAQTEVAVVEEEEEEASRWSGVMQFDFTNAYYFRGILNERSDFIFQPWAELYLNLYASDDGPIRDLTVGMGVWNSIHHDKTLAENSPSTFYETDWYPVISIGLPWDLSLTTTYYFYLSPNGAFDEVQELNFELAWDDSETLGRFALAPWMNIATETYNTSLGNDEGTGMQFGVEPLLYEFESDRLPLAFTFPLEIGISASDYYEGDDGSDETFGYINWGVTATLPLPFIDKSFGAWSAILSGKGFYFGDTLAEVNGGDDTYGVVMGSLGVEF